MDHMSDMRDVGAPSRTASVSRLSVAQTQTAGVGCDQNADAVVPAARLFLLGRPDLPIVMRVAVVVEAVVRSTSMQRNDCPSRSWSLKMSGC